jgi:hypothetical protein
MNLLLEDLRRLASEKGVEYKNDIDMNLLLEDMRMMAANRCLTSLS